MKVAIAIFLLFLLSLSVGAQDFENGDLEGPILGLSQIPSGWNPVPQSDPNCFANFGPGATADLTSTTQPDASIGLIGNPYSGSTFVSGIAANSGGYVYNEGIKQNVSGFMVDSIYEVHFYQAVVRQFNLLDFSGSWSVYLDNTFIGVSDPSFGSGSYNSTSFNWDKRSIVFTATSTNHTFKFLAKDDDPNGEIDEYDAGGALRMGIDSLFITPWCNLNADLGHDTILCGGNSLLLSVTSADADYLWQDGSAEDHFLVTEPGSYSVSVSNVCGSLSDQVYIDYDYSVEELDLGDDLSLCDGEVYVVEIDLPNIVYSWQDNSQESTFEISQNGLYWVDINSDNCFNTDTISALFFPIPEFTLQNDTLLCEGESIIIYPPIDNVSYLWQDNSSLPFLQVNQAGEYWLEVNENGCTKIDYINVDYIPIPRINFGPDTLMCLGQNLRLNVNHQHSEFMWQNNSTNANLMVDDAGMYIAEVSNECGFDKDSIFVDFDDCKCFVYIPNSFTPNGDGRNDEFSVEYDCFFDFFEFSVFNRWGELIFKSNDPNGSWNGSAKGKELPIGVYAYRVEYISYGRDPIYKSGTVTLLH